jgi:hypothetical protein
VSDTKQKRKPRKSASKLERDMAIARSVAPTELGGEGLMQKEAAAKFGLSQQRVQQILHEPDVQEAHKGWLQGMFKKQRATGDKVHAAFEELVEAGDARVVIDYFRRMGVDVGPGVDVNIEKLELTIPPEFANLLKVNPAYQEQQEELSEPIPEELSHKVESLQELSELNEAGTEEIDETSSSEPAIEES